MKVSYSTHSLKCLAKRYRDMNPMFFELIGLTVLIGWLANGIRGAVWGVVGFLTFSVVVDFLDYVLNKRKGR